MKKQSGKSAITIYEYDLEGVYIRRYSSIAELRKKYYPDDNGNRPLFIKNIKGVDYEIFYNTICFKQRVFRDDVVYYVKMINSKLCNLRNPKDDRPVEMFNIKGEKIAEFINSSAAFALVGEETLGSNFYTSLKRGNYSKKRFQKDFYFQFKND